MYITRVKLKNWRNFQSVDVKLGQRVFLVGPNASGKSNFIDAIRFLHDITSPEVGGLQRAVEKRGGLKQIRCLSARRVPGLEITVELGTAQNEPKYEYSLGIEKEQAGAKRTLILHEKVSKDGEIILSRPDKDDNRDTMRKTQTHLEQISLNADFREITDCFRSTTYLHLVPQLVRNAGSYSGHGLPGDPFGRDLIGTIAKTSKDIRTSRLKKIEGVLKEIVPQIGEFSLVFDEKEGGIPHLEVRYDHWRGYGAKQRESEFSDGTLRLIGMFWSMLAGSSVLLLEEPEISLNVEIVKKLPYLFSRLLKKNARQIIVTTHSHDMLSDESISGDEALNLSPGIEGTEIKTLSSDAKDRELLEVGLSVADVVSSKRISTDRKQLVLF